MFFCKHAHSGLAHLPPSLHALVSKIMHEAASQALEAFDVIDLDPYGTASPFLDAAVQAVADGGERPRSHDPFSSPKRGPAVLVIS